MSAFAIIWVAIVSLAAALGLRNAAQLYRRPRELRSAGMYMDASQARRAAFAVLIGLPIIWLLIVLSTFGLLGPSPLQGAS